MKYIKIGALILAGILAGIIAGYFIRGCHDRQDAYKIVTALPPINYDIKPVSIFYGDLLECRLAPIVIDGTIKGKVFTAKASDGCKAAERGFALDIPDYKNVFGLAYMPVYDLNGKLYHCGMFEYYRFIKAIGIGGGIMAGKVDGGQPKDWLIGAKLGIQARFK